MRQITNFIVLGLLVSLNSFAADTKLSKITGVTVDHNDAGALVDLTFDKPFSAKSIKPTYERNFIQFVFNKTAIDTARIIPVSQSVSANQSFQKVFAYPYSPEVARVRFIFGTPKAPQGKVAFWNTNAKTIRVLIKGTTDLNAIEKTAKATNSKSTEQNVEAPKENVTKQEPADSTDEKTLLSEVVTKTKDIDIHNPDSVKEVLESEKQAISGVQKTESESNDRSIGVKTNASKYFAKMMISLFAILCLIAGIFFLIKRYSNKLNKLPFGKKERMIQVVATHQLGNKKSISLVKVAGDYLVLGVGNDNISLITRLGPEADIGKYIDERFWGGTFEKHLKHFEKNEIPSEEKQKVTKNPEPSLSSLARNYDGVRDVAVPESFESNLKFAAEEVSDKVELSSFRSNIKEKLSKLKPLA